MASQVFSQCICNSFKYWFTSARSEYRLWPLAVPSKWCYGDLGSNPSNSLKELYPVIEWIAELYANSNKLSHLNQVFLSFPMYTLSIVSKNSLTISVWPSICGWCVEANTTQVCRCFITSFQNSFAHLMSLLQNTLSGNPNFDTTHITNRSANPSVFSWLIIAMNWACFDSQSTTMSIAVKPSDLGRLTIRSRDLEWGT